MHVLVMFLRFCARAAAEACNVMREPPQHADAALPQSADVRRPRAVVAMFNQKKKARKTGQTLAVIRRTDNNQPAVVSVCCVVWVGG